MQEALHGGISSGLTTFVLAHRVTFDPFLVLVPDSGTWMLPTLECYSGYSVIKGCVFM